MTKFAGKVSPMGDKFIIIVPKAKHADVSDLVGKQLIVKIEEI